MALLDSEVVRIRAEMGFHVLTVSAEPYISYVSIFDQIIQPYTQAGAKTTSATAVEITAAPEQKTVVLASATGFASGARVVIDVDARQETVTVQNLSSTNLTALLSKPHAGTYPVTVEGGETILREILASIAATKTQLGLSSGEGSLKKVDEIEFYQSGDTTFGNLGLQLSFWRDQLAAALGLESMWQAKASGASRIAVY